MISRRRRTTVRQRLPDLLHVVAVAERVEVVAGGEQVLERAVVQRVGDPPASARLGVERLRDEPAARGRQLGDLRLGEPALDGVGDHVRDRLEERRRLRAEAVRLKCDRRQHAERVAAAADDRRPPRCVPR